MLFEILAVGAVALGVKGLKEAFKDEESAQKTMDGVNRFLDSAEKNMERKIKNGQIDEETYENYQKAKNGEMYKNIRNMRSK
ncbi:MAG: hypothetical protein IKP69_02010 [Oscillospiraceae bacterium]|nr:hypothetical protein [Oscillospiraceae bacterium]